MAGLSVDVIYVLNPLIQTDTAVDRYGYRYRDIS